MRKVLSFMLSLVMMLSIFGVNAVASDTSYDSETFSFLSQLGITKDVIGNEDGKITRAEFTAMIVRALNLTNLTPDTTLFEDCSDSPFTSEIHIAKSIGITNGTSANAFSPNHTVTASVAAKMAVAALGYTAKAEATGGYPTAYLQIAASLDLFTGVNSNDDVLSVSDAFTFIYNMMLAEVAVASGVENGNVVSQTADGINLLTENFGYTYVSGTVDTVGSEGVNYESSADNSIEIGGTFYKTENDFSPLLGCDVDAWYDDQGYVRIAIPSSSNNVVTLSAEEVVGYTDFKLETEDADSYKKKVYNIEKGFSFILNGRLISHNDSSFKFNKGTLKLIDNDGNGKYDFVVAEKTEYFVIGSVNAVNGVIYDSNSAYKSISLESDDEYSVELTLNGTPASVYDLEESMVCEVLMSEDYKLCKVNAYLSVVSGVVAEKGNDYYIIDGKSYKLTDYFNNLGIDISIGSAYDFLISSDGSIISVANSASSSMKYGYFMDCASKGGLESTVVVKVMTTIGDIQIFTLKDKIVMDGKPAEASYVKDILKPADVPKYQVIRYKESDGVITHLDLFDEGGEEWVVGEYEPDDNSLTKYADKLSVHYRSSVTFGIPNVSFKNAVIFEVPKALATDPNVKYSDELFMVSGTGSLTNDATYKVDVYDYDERYVPSVIVLYRSTDSSILATPSSSGVGYMVREMSDAIDSEGVAQKLLKVYGNGKYAQYFIDPVSYESMVKQKKIPKQGDIVRLTTNAKGYVVGISIDVTYDKESKEIKVNYGQSGVSNLSYDYLSYYSGRVLAIGNSHIALNAENAPSGAVSGGGIVNLSLGSARYVIYNTTNGEIYAGNSQSVVSKLNAGLENASRVVCKTSHYSVGTVYIYIEE